MATRQTSHSIITQQAIRPPGKHLIRLLPNRLYGHQANISFDYYPTGCTATRQTSHSIITQQAIRPPGKHLIRLLPSRLYGHQANISFNYNPTGCTAIRQTSHSIITQLAKISFKYYSISPPLCIHPQGILSATI